MDLKNLTNEKLAEFAKNNGNLKEVMDEFYTRFNRKIKIFIKRKIRNLETVEDLTHDVFVKIQENLNNYERNRGQISTWIYSFAKNHSRNYLKRIEIGKPILENYSMNNLKRKPLLPDQDIIEKQTREILKNAVQDLPEKYREVIISRYYEDLPVIETALLLGIKEGTVKSRTNRGIMHLRKNLSNRGGDLC